MGTVSAPAYFPSNRIRRVHVLVFYLISLGVGAVMFLAVQAWARFLAAGSNDGSNLRQIVQCMLIHARENDERLPSADDVWSYAEILSKQGLETDAFWRSRADPSYSPNKRADILLVTFKGKIPNPAFRKIPLSYAIPVTQLTTKMPMTVPVIWTRGLKSDGTWASHSPYGNDGGRITFLGGSIISSKNLSDNGGELQRFDGKGKTANILEALPPGTRVSEYQPTPSEQKAWSRTNWLRAAVRSLVSVWSVGGAFLGMILIPAFGHSASARKISFTVLTTIILVLALLAGSIVYVGN